MSKSLLFFLNGQVHLKEVCCNLLYFTLCSFPLVVGSDGRFPGGEFGLSSDVWTVGKWKVRASSTGERTQRSPG